MIFPLKICIIETRKDLNLKRVRKRLVYIHNWYNNKTKYFNIDGNHFIYK